MSVVVPLIGLLGVLGFFGFLTAGLFWELLGAGLVGNPHLLKDPFIAAPSGVYFQRSGTTGVSHERLENFIVSIANYTLPDFDIELVVTEKDSRVRLDAYADHHFDAVFESYRPLLGKLLLPATWGRQEKTAILLLLSSVPVAYGRLRCERGRLVLTAQRKFSKSISATQTPEALLAGVKADLDGFVRAIETFEGAPEALP